MAPVETMLNTFYPDESTIVLSIIGTPSDTAFSVDQINTLVYLAIDKAAKAIMQYTGWTAIQSGYESVVSSLAISYLMTDAQSARLFINKPFIASQTQGSRSATYKADTPVFDADGLTASVKAVLPLPMLKVY